MKHTDIPVNIQRVDASAADEIDSDESPLQVVFIDRLVYLANRLGPCTVAHLNDALRNTLWESAIEHGQGWDLQFMTRHLVALRITNVTP